MSERPAFPPMFRPFAVTPELDPFDRGLSVATEGAEPGTLLWSIGQDACECAVVLAPEQPLERSLPVVLVTMLGVADALGSLIPPVVAVTFGWPDRIEINGGIVGGVRMASAEPAVAGAIPGWMVLGFGVAMRGRWDDDTEPGADVHRTTLEDEGCGDILTTDLLEAFSRHFLSWINRWQEDGIDPVRQAWMARATGLAKPVEIEIGGQRTQGTFSGLTDNGAIRLVRDGATHTIALDEAMRIPTWAV